MQVKVTEEYLGTVERGPLRIDMDQHLVWWRGRCARLSRREFLLVAYLARREHVVRTRADLLDVIDPHCKKEMLDGAINSHVKRIRRKLESAIGSSHFIRSEWGGGYYWQDVP